MLTKNISLFKFLCLLVDSDSYVMPRELILRELNFLFSNFNFI